jgi:16S rRNA G966 N2-methylase RsmD
MRCEILKSKNQGANAMPHQAGDTVSRLILNSTSAQLFVADIKATCDFYTHKLDFVFGDPPFHGQVTRDQARLALRVVREPVFIGNIREREHLLSASLTYQTAEVRFH